MVDQGWSALPVDFGLPEAGVVLRGAAVGGHRRGAYLPTLVTTTALLVALGGPADRWRPVTPAWWRGTGYVRRPATVNGSLAHVPGGEAAGAAGAGRRRPVGALRRRTVSTSLARRRRPTSPGRSPTSSSSGAATRSPVFDDPGGAVEAAVVRLWCADALGSARGASRPRPTYATVREQFGQPIGQFQGVKHRVRRHALRPRAGPGGDVGRLRAPTSGDEGRLATAVAAALAPEAFLTVAKGCIQVLGGIGFTWEHDAHLYLKRALATAAFVGSAPRRGGRTTTRLAAGGARRAVTVDLPPEAESLRDAIRAELVDLARSPPRRSGGVRMADGGLDHAALVDALGRGRHAGRAAGHRRGAGRRPPQAPPPARSARRVLPTILAHGTPDQQERVPAPDAAPRRGCQLFSEPGAGSTWRRCRRRPAGSRAGGC